MGAWLVNGGPKPSSHARAIRRYLARGAVLSLAGLDARTGSPSPRSGREIRSCGKPQNTERTLKMKSNEDMTIKEARELIAKAAELRKELGMDSGSQSSAGASHSFKEGEKVFIRCVTHYYTGRVQCVTDSDVVLTDAAWIADTHQFSKALLEGFGDGAEIEPYPNGVKVCRGAMVDHCPWDHDLPKEQR